MPWAETGATQYHAQLGLPDKDYGDILSLLNLSLPKISLFVKKKIGSSVKSEVAVFFVFLHVYRLF